MAVPRGMGWISGFRNEGDKQGEITLVEVISIGKGYDALLQYTFEHDRYPKFRLIIVPGETWDVEYEGRRIGGGTETPSYQRLSNRTIVELLNKGGGRSGRYYKLTVDEKRQAIIIMEERFGMKADAAKRNVEDANPSDIRWLIDNYGQFAVPDVQELMGKKPARSY